MPLETFTGPSLPPLFAQAHAVLGADAVVLSVRRAGRDGGSLQYELVAADPDTAAETRRSVAGAPAASAPPKQTTSPHVVLQRMRMEGRPAVFALVGPTGSGKTTTIAKLANHPDVFAQNTVGLICLDSYRIGGVEQLGIFADLSHLPMEVVYDSKDIPRAFKKLRQCDVILVDTAGRGPRARSDMEQTAIVLRRLEPVEVHLVLPAGVRAEVLRRVVRNHAEFALTHVLVTKTDEDPTDRVPFELARECRLPVRWLTNGQEVPTDLQAVPADETAVRDILRGVAQQTRAAWASAA